MGEYKARPHEIHLRLSEEEYRALEKNRAKCRLPQQTYLRKISSVFLRSFRGSETI